MLHFKHYVHDDPAAPWVVFVHGAGGSSSIWFLQIKDFIREFNVLLVDLRGHGRSKRMVPPPGVRYDFRAITVDILDVLDHLAVRRAHFIGISLGTILIRQLGELAPERVCSMIMGGAIINLNLRSRVLVTLGNLFKHLVPYMWLYRFFAWIIMPYGRHKRSRLLFVTEAKKVAQEEFLRWFALTYRIGPVLRAFEERDPHIPVLYLMGDEDHMFLPAARSLVARHPGSRLEVIANSGHVCNVDQPREFNERAISFIKEISRC